MSESCGAAVDIETAKRCKEFIHEYYHIGNSRPDLLYRLYSTSARISISETVRGKKSITACAFKQDEIRYLTTSIQDSIYAVLTNLSIQPSTNNQLLIMVNGVFRHKASQQDHTFTQTFLLLTAKNRLAISSDALQIYSHNLKRNLMSGLQSKIKNSKLQISNRYPPVIDTKIRSKVHMPTEDNHPEEHRPQVGSLYFIPTEQEEASLTKKPTMKEESFDSKKDRRIETDTAREATAESFRTEGWDAFSKDKPIDLLPEENLAQRALSGHEGGDAFLETQMPTTGKRSGLFLSCFDEKQTGQEIKADGENGKNGSFLRVFGFQPIPDGDPIEWDLSQDAVLTQLRTYHEVVHRFRMPLPKRRLRSLNSHVEWHHRTVYLEDLPRDVHPESLRRAFEMMFGEIEEENGIILASARHSSIAYIVFKCLESAHAVGLSDFWIKGSKITIQKYRPPFSDADSIGG